MMALRSFPQTEREYRRCIEQLETVPPDCDANGFDAGTDAIPFPVPARDLGDRNRILTVDEFLAEPDEPTRWVWHGYAARGEVTVVSGPPKVGKTTLLLQCAGSVCFGTGFLNRSVDPTAVLWLNLEQHPRRMRMQVRALGIAGCPFHVAHAAPDDLNSEISDRKIGLVVLDSLSRYWDVTDENDAVQVTAGIETIRKIAELTDAAVVLIHHDRKSGGEDGMNIRGSGALLAAVDYAISMKRDKVETRRILEIVSREMDAVPRRHVVELANGFYRSLGAVRDVHEGEQKQAILDAVTAEPQTYEDLVEATGLGMPTVKKMAKRLADTSKIKRTGIGKKGDPLRFSRNDSGEPDSVSDKPNPRTGTVSETEAPADVVS